MQTGVFMESHLVRLVPCVLSMFLLIHLSQAAPGLPGTQREEAVDGRDPSVALANPFDSGDRRLLQSYIQSSLKDGQGGPEISTWEQEVFFLFRLYDYDRSGLLDGLEMMKLLSDYNSYHTPGAHTNELVVSMVDFLLQSQDLNQDGLLAPSELLSPPLPHTQLREEAHEELQPQDEEHLEFKTEDEELINQVVDKQHEQQIPEAPAAEHGQDHKVPVHQGQPEM